MSVEFDVELKLSSEKTEAIIYDWLDGDHEFLQEPEFEGGDEEADDADDPERGRIMHLLADGSTRGLVVSLTEKALHLRLSALASRLDWTLAYSLMAALLKNGGGTPVHEEGHELAAADLTPEKAVEACTRDFLFSMVAFRGAIASADGETMQVPIGVCTLDVELDDTPEKPDEAAMVRLEERLAAQVRKYYGAYFASQFGFDNGVTASTWPFIPTVIGEPMAIITPKAANEFESDDQTLIPWARVRRVLGNRVEKIGDAVWFLPEMDMATPENAELLEELIDGSLDDHEAISVFHMVHGAVSEALAMFIDGKSADEVKNAFMKDDRLDEDNAAYMTELTGRSFNAMKSFALGAASIEEGVMAVVSEGFEMQHVMYAFEAVRDAMPGGDD